MPQHKRHRNQHPHDTQGPSRTYTRFAKLALIGFIAISPGLVGIAAGQMENRTDTIAGLATLEWDDMADHREVSDEALNSER